ncbi:MAG: hypothetical protein JST26_10575 [Bacteroidetes bacterium]|nr:hypothetical protein [Bacteroidota bacterium]
MQKFDVVQQGPYKILLTNPHYILIDKSCITLFDGMAEQLDSKPVQIIDRILQTNNDRYVELDLKRSIEPFSIHSMDSRGLKIWKYDESVFVSGELKERFMTLPCTGLKFNLGFSGFAS